MSHSILFVDDEPMIRAFMKSLLSKATDYDVAIAESGREAVEIVKSRDRPFDVLITDVMMPEMDGFETMEEVSALSPGIVCIVLTASSSPENYRQALNKGAFEFIGKPIKNDLFLIAIEKALKHGEIYKENARLKSEAGGAEAPSRARKKLSAAFAEKAKDNCFTFTPTSSCELLELDGLQTAVDFLAETRFCHIVLDMVLVEDMGQEQARVLLKAADYAKKQGVKMHLCNCGPQLKRKLENLGVEETVPIRRTLNSVTKLIGFSQKIVLRVLESEIVLVRLADVLEEEDLPKLQEALKDHAPWRRERAAFDVSGLVDLHPAILEALHQYMNALLSNGIRSPIVVGVNRRIQEKLKTGQFHRIATLVASQNDLNADLFSRGAGLTTETIAKEDFQALRLKGVLTRATLDAFHNELIAADAMKGERHISINAVDLDHVDMAGMNKLRELNDALRAKNKILVFCNLNNHVHSSFQTVRLDESFSIVKTEGEAVQFIVSEGQAIMKAEGIALEGGK